VQHHVGSEGGTVQANKLRGMAGAASNAASPLPWGWGQRQKGRRGMAAFIAAATTVVKRERCGSVGGQ